MKLEKVLEAVTPVDERAYNAAKKKWMSIGKPLDGLGYLEEMVCCVAAAQGTSEVKIRKRAVAVFCADNGVVAEGVSQVGSEITALVAQQLCERGTTVCVMAGQVGCEVIPVDVGICTDIKDERLLRFKTAYGTGNIAQGCAMQPEQLFVALEAGIDLAIRLAHEGYQLLAAGEMGIGNTTTSSAVASVLLGRAPQEMTGRGAGLSDEGLKCKISAIERAIEVNQPDKHQVLNVLAKVGGFDIAAMCGFYLGAAYAKCPVVLDGFISGVAALCAVRLCPEVRGYLLASHCSAESAAEMVLNELDIKAPIQAGMHLGEGTGAVALMPLLDVTLAVYDCGKPFDAFDMDPYVFQG